MILSGFAVFAIRQLEWPTGDVSITAQDWTMYAYYAHPSLRDARNVRWPAWVGLRVAILNSALIAIMKSESESPMRRPTLHLYLYHGL